MQVIDSEMMTRPTCPECGGRDVVEMASTRVEYPVAGIAGGRPETMSGKSAGGAEFDGFECLSCSYESNEIGDFVAPDPDFEPSYGPWRHGGWYVYGVRHKNGGVGCVSRNYPDRRWRIVCERRDGEHTYRSRDEAARAEYALTRAGVIE
ncbi:MAG TPA: hypothetical protein VHZ54_10625 [Solirubrobacterales bacterium]|jgi:hypothetical protein|nr:hypothetical protein [Solirubrobacterales bacterium]